MIESNEIDQLRESIDNSYGDWKTIVQFSHKQTMAKQIVLTALGHIDITFRENKHDQEWILKQWTTKFKHESPVLRRLKSINLDETFKENLERL